MSSTEFNVDSLLDDINDVDISTPWGGSSMKDVSLLPGSEKSLANTSGIFRNDSYSRTQNKTQMPSYLIHQTTKTGINASGQYSSESNNMQSNATSSSALTNVDNFRGTMSNAQSSRTSSSKSQSAAYFTGRSIATSIPHQDSQIPREAFGASCSLSKVTGDRVDSSRNGSQCPKTVRCGRSDEGAAKGALCDDFDDDDDDLKSDSKHSRSSSSYHATVGSCKKELTVQRDQDKTGTNSSKLNDNNFWGNRGSDDNVSRMSQSQSSRGSSVDAARRGQGQGRGLHIEDAEFADIEALFDSNILGEDTLWDADRDHKIRERDRVPVIHGTSSSSSSSSSSSASSSRTMKSESTYCNRVEYHPSSDAVRPTATPSTCISQSQSQSQSQSVNGSGRASGTAIPIPAAVSASCKARCTRIVLSGTASVRGFRSSVFSKCACDNLRCLSCNFKVHTFSGNLWNQGPSVDYMFFRNNTPNELKLSAQLIRSAAHCAYCCQCSWTHTAMDRILTPGASGDPQWVCAGH